MNHTLARVARERPLDPGLFRARDESLFSGRGFLDELPDEPEDLDGRDRHRTIWISDTHLGTRGCRADLLRSFLEENEAETLYLVGDILDGWRLRKSWYWDEDHNAILANILEKSARGTRVVYVAGNHDEFLRGYLGLVCGGIELVDEAVHETADGRRLLVLHGDRFDACIRNARWLAVLGDHAYRACMRLNAGLNLVRRLFGLGHWSLSAYLKHKVKNAVNYIGDFEQAVAAEASQRGFEGVVCGHIHHAETRTVEGVLYCNDGDWVESCTALVEEQSGELSILRWAERDGQTPPLARRHARRASACAS